MTCAPDSPRAAVDAFVSLALLLLAVARPVADLNVVTVAVLKVWWKVRWGRMM